MYKQDFYCDWKEDKSSPPTAANKKSHRPTTVTITKNDVIDEKLAMSDNKIKKVNPRLADLKYEK